MQRFHKIAGVTALVLAVSAVGPAVAQEAPLAGNWCAPEDAQIMFIEATTIGFNEHTICTPGDADALTGARIDTQLDCKNIYFNNGKAVEAFPEAVDMTAELTKEGALLVTLRDDPEPVLWKRCDF